VSEVVSGIDGLLYQIIAKFGVGPFREETELIASDGLIAGL
jgi:hypothetical protein